MPSTQRTPPSSAQSNQDSPQRQEVPELSPDLEVHQQMPVQNYDGVKELVKRKNTYAKKRLTMTENILNPMENKVQVQFRNAEIDTLRRYLSAADDAIQNVNDIVSSASHTLDPTEIDAFLSLSDENLSRYMDLATRINVIQDKMDALAIAPHSNATTPSITSRSHANNGPHKLDNTFRPEPLDSDATPPVFYQWREQFQVYLERNSMLNAPIKQVRILFNKCLTPRMERTLARVCVISELNSVQDILKKLEQHILKSNNLFTRRFHYFNCIQHKDESIQDYITRFRELGDYANFESFSYSDNMACRLVTGVYDERLRTELLRLRKTDFDTFQDFALSWQFSMSNATEMSTRPSNDRNGGASINKLSAYKSEKKKSFTNKFQGTSSKNKQQSRPSSESSSQSQDNQPCGYCGLSVHYPGGCQARNQQCSYCKKFGHYSRVCKKRLAQQNTNDVGSSRHVRAVEEEPETDQESDLNEEANVNVVDGTVFSVTSPVSSKPTPRLMASFSFNGKFVAKMWALPDTGASVSVLPYHFARSWNILQEIESNDTPLKAVEGSRVDCVGSITLTTSILGATTPVIFFVCKNIDTILISWHALSDMAVINFNFPDVASIDASQVLENSTFNSLKNNLINTFTQVFSSKLQAELSCMRGEHMKIHLKSSIDWPNVRQTYKPRPIPIPLRKATKNELDLMIKRGIIIPVTQPTQFTSPLLIVPKKEGVRLVVDYTELNRYVRRPIHPFPSVPEIKALIPTNAKYFATLDALQGYWQVPLDKQSQLLTTFITPWGRFCYVRAPMGLASSGDEFCRRGDLAFNNIEGVLKVVDDLLIYAQSREELQNRITNVLKAADQAGITLSSDKFHIGHSVSFLGLKISSQGIQPDSRHLDAISQFPTPANRTDLRSFLGLVNQFTSFSTKIAALCKSIRPLLSVSSQWLWTPEHDDAFNKIKQALIQAPVLQYFNPKLPTKLVTDASRLNGLGFALMQKHPTGWALISCGSRFINNTEANYSVCELEALAIVWAIRKSRLYLMGLPSFDVVTDHRPLVSMFNSSRLARSENPRLIRLMQQVVAYNFVVHWTPGRLHLIPDALSRSPHSMPSTEDRLLAINNDAQTQVRDPALKDIIAEAKNCPQYIEFKTAVTSKSAADIKKLPSSSHGHLKVYTSIWDSLSIDPISGLIIKDGCKIFIPQGYRKKLLSLAHVSHQGISKTKARLQDLYFWAGMSNEVVQLLQSCNLCQKFRQSQPEQPIQPHSLPSGPFRAVSCDLFDYAGSFTLVLVDRYSAWPLVSHYNRSPSSSQLIKTLSMFFADFGIPTSLRHDGARPFTSSEFTSFLKENNIQDELSSAYNPRSNGHAEAAVKNIKLLVKKCWINRQLDYLRFNNALLEFRNTPSQLGKLSPAQMLLGRNLRTLLPAINYKNVPQTAIKKALTEHYQSIKKSYNSFNSRKTYLRPLRLGDKVRIQDPISKQWDKLGEIQEVRPGKLSYYVRSQGKVYLRNRRFLKKVFSDP